MVTREQVDAQLAHIGVKIKNWGAAEVRELPQILADDEEITAYVHGWYEGGFASLFATSERLLLIDKRMMNLTIEDVRYDMIAEVDFTARLMDATVRINTLNKTMRFTSMKQQRLRDLTKYVQDRVMQLRRQQFSYQQFEHMNGQAPAYAQTLPSVGSALAPEAAATIPVQAPQLTPMRRLTTANPFTKQALTTKQYTFLPRVPRRFRPE